MHTFSKKTRKFILEIEKSKNRMYSASSLESVYGSRSDVRSSGTPRDSHLDRSTCFGINLVPRSGYCPTRDFFWKWKSGFYPENIRKMWKSGFYPENYILHFFSGGSWIRESALRTSHRRHGPTTVPKHDCAKLRGNRHTDPEKNPEKIRILSRKSGKSRKYPEKLDEAVWQEILSVLLQQFFWHSKTIRQSNSESHGAGLQLDGWFCSTFPRQQNPEFYQGRSRIRILSGKHFPYFFQERIVSRSRPFAPATDEMVPPRHRSTIAQSCGETDKRVQKKIQKKSGKSG